MNNQITLAYLDHDDLDAYKLYVVSFYGNHYHMIHLIWAYLQTQLTTEILESRIGTITSKFIGIKDHQILIGYMKVNDEKML